MAVIADLLDVPGAKTFLAVGEAGTERMGCTEKIGHHWLHTGTSKKCGGVVGEDDWGGGNNFMTVGREKVQIFLTQLIAA